MYWFNALELSAGSRLTDAPARELLYADLGVREDARDALGELVLEKVRLQSFSAKPSRFAATLVYMAHEDDPEEFLGFAREEKITSTGTLVYKVRLVDPNAPSHEEKGPAFGDEVWGVADLNVAWLEHFALNYWKDGWNGVDHGPWRRLTASPIEIVKRIGEV